MTRRRFGSAGESRMERTGSAVWKGGLKDGKGTVSTPSGVLANAAYGFSTRFENAKGTNPEELVAAAHAGCFSMAFSGELGKAGLTPESIETRAVFDFDKTDAGWAVKSIRLDVTAKVPKADRAAVQKAAEAAEKGCPISRLLKAPISLQLKVL